LRQTFSHLSGQTAQQKQQQHEALQVLETVIDDTDDKIRLVSGYKKQLVNTISHAIQYTRQLLQQIPPPVDISLNSFTNNPYANAIFVNKQELRNLFRHSSEIQEYLQTSLQKKPEYCYALLCMKKTEKTILGMRMSGDMLVKDVRQTAINFSDHQLSSPSNSEADIRDKLYNCLFAGLTTNALGHISQLRFESHQLGIEYRRQQTLLRQLQAQAKKELDSPTHLRQITRIQQQLKSLQQDLMGTHLVTPERALEEVKAVFKQPQNFVQLECSTLCINRMKIKVEHETKVAHLHLDLCEAVIENEHKRIIFLVKIPFNELLSN